MKKRVQWRLLFFVLLLSTLVVAIADPFNTPPIFLEPTDSHVTAYSEKDFELDIEVEDVDNDILKVQVQHLPEWCTFDPYLLQLYGRPERVDKGEYFVTIKVDDGRVVRTKRINLEVEYGHTAKQHLEETMTGIWKEKLSSLQGASAAVLSPEGELTTFAMGSCGRRSSDDVSPDHKFRIASVSKLMTATLIMRLAEEGQLSLDDRLAEHLKVPGLPNGDKITIRQLMSHTAGVVDHLNHPSFYRGNWKYREWSERDIFRFAAVRRARFNPGESYAYSNTGYYLLGELAEKLTGKPLGDAYRSYIFGPVGMENTLYDDFSTRRKPIEGLAENRRAYEYHQSAVGAAGAVISTPSDMARFGRALYNGELVSEASLKEMQKDIGAEKGGDHYGLGMRLWDDFGIKHIGHTGALMGYRSILMYLPEYGITIALTTHHSHYNWYDLVNGVMLEMADYYR
ncbi:MAG: serine hydrolase [Bacteroidetes bacterium]|jgi:CubicO group peptidase (beta-lactamase class C family)|nr:serine hydrolase [Bacteroidota bacterium]